MTHELTGKFKAKSDFLKYFRESVSAIFKPVLTPRVL